MGLHTRWDSEIRDDQITFAFEYEGPDILCTVSGLPRIGARVTRTNAWALSRCNVVDIYDRNIGERIAYGRAIKLYVATVKAARIVEDATTRFYGGTARSASRTTNYDSLL